MATTTSTKMTTMAAAQRKKEKRAKTKPILPPQTVTTMLMLSQNEMDESLTALFMTVDADVAASGVADNDDQTTITIGERKDRVVTATADGVTISSICKPAKSVSFTPIRWVYFVAMLVEIDEEAKQLNRKTRPVAYRKHIGDGYYGIDMAHCDFIFCAIQILLLTYLLTYYVSATNAYLCIDLRRFILPYGCESDEKVRPTKSSIALRLDEWCEMKEHSVCCYGWLFPPCPQRAPSAFQF